MSFKIGDVVRDKTKKKVLADGRREAFFGTVTGSQVVGKEVQYLVKTPYNYGEGQVPHGPDYTVAVNGELAEPGVWFPEKQLVLDE